MDLNEIEEEEIRPLIFNYLFHFILYILIFILHIIIYTKIFWISDIFEKLYFLGTFFGIIYFIFPIFPILMILLKNFKLKRITIIKKASLILLIISIVIGILISVVISINTLNSKIFYLECPFSLTLSNLNHIFQSYYDKSNNQDEIKDNCKSRRCILDSVNQEKEYPYIYLCNYNPSYEFEEEEDKIYTRYLPNNTEISSKQQLKCSLIGLEYSEFYFDNYELYDYLRLCYYFTEFYYCTRFNKPQKTYELNLDSSCPETNYLFLLYILCVLMIIIDIVISMLPWGVEYMSLKRIIRMMSGVRRKANSRNSTARSSVASNKEDSFKKEGTVIIVLPLNNEENINIKKNNNKLPLKESHNELINKNADEDEKDEGIIKPIIIQNSERAGLKHNLAISPNNNNSPNFVSVYNKNQKDLNISTDFHNNIINNNINMRDKIEADKNNK